MRPPIAILAVAAALIAGCGDDPAPDEREAAIGAAVTAFAKAESSGIDLSDGPCIAERLPGLDDWVADIAHDPRGAVDDDPANQCERYRDGEASHFVELTPDGDLIRAE